MELLSDAFVWLVMALYTVGMTWLFASPVWVFPSVFAAMLMRASAGWSAETNKRRIGFLKAFLICQIVVLLIIVWYVWDAI